MKKLFLMLAVASLSLNAMAQEDPTEKYSVATNSFWSNWFIQTNLNWSSYTIGTHGLFSAPFRVCFSDYRILFCGHLRKCAILILRLPLLSAHCAGDFGQTHLSDIARRHTQGVQRFRGIEIYNTAEILIREVW